MKNVGTNIRVLRASKAWTQSYLAKRAGLSQGYLCSVEAGEANPTLEAVEKVANAFEIPMRTLFEDSLLVPPTTNQERSGHLRSNDDQHTHSPSNGGYQPARERGESERPSGS